MRRLLAATLLAFLVAGCSGDNSATEEPPAAPEEALATGTETSNAPPGQTNQDPSAADVIEHFQTIGLPADNAQEVTSEICTTEGCSTAYEAEGVTVLDFETDSAAEAYAAANEDLTYRNSLVVLLFGTQDEDQRDEYQAALDELVGV